MDPSTDQILAALYQIDDRMVWLAIKILVGAVIILLLKSFTENVASYILFRFDRYVGIGTPVELYNKKGRIQNATWFEITIETDCGFIRIPPKNWRSSKYIVLKDDLVLRNRRRSDINQLD